MAIREAEKAGLATRVGPLPDDQAQAKCEAITLKGRAHAEAGKLRIEAVARAMAEDGGQLFLELERARALMRWDSGACLPGGATAFSTLRPI